MRVWAAQSGFESMLECAAAQRPLEKRGRRTRFGVEEGALGALKVPGRFKS